MRRGSAVWGGVGGRTELVGDLAERIGQGMDPAAFPAGALPGGGAGVLHGALQDRAQRVGVPGSAGSGQRGRWDGVPVDAVARGLIALLDVLEFRSNNTAHRPVIEALELIGRYAKAAGSRFNRGLR